MSTIAIWHWAGYFIAAIAVVLAVWSLWLRDGRKRIGARCPKCWYDLQGVAPAQPGPGWTCPECGHRASAEKQLHRRRRHWRQTGLAASLLAVAYGVWTTPRIQRSGWVGAVPTTVLIAALPWTVPPDDDPLWAYSLDRFMARNKAKYPLYFELYQRAREKQPLSWQRRLIAEMCLARVPDPLPQEGQFLESGYSDLISAVFRDGQSISASVERRLDRMVRIDVLTRDRWPAGAPIYIHIDERRFWGGRDSRLTFKPVDSRLGAFGREYLQRRIVGTFQEPWGDDLVRGPVMPAALDRLDCDVDVVTGDWEKDSWRHQASQRISIPVRAVASAHEILTPAPQRDVGMSFTHEIFSDEPPTVCFILSDWTWPNRMELSIRPDESILESLKDLTVGVSITALRNGYPMFETEAWWAWHWYDLAANIGNVAPLGRVILSPLCDVENIPTDGCWELHIKGDPAVALRNFSAARYWQGEITMPVGLEIWDPESGWREP